MKLFQYRYEDSNNHSLLMYRNYELKVSLNKEHQKKAIHYGLVDEICELQKGVEKADFIIISTPVNVSPDILQNVLDRINNQIVIDVGSTKEKIIEKIR